MANSSFINPLGDVPNWIHARNLDRTLEGAAGPIRRPLMKPIAMMQDGEPWVRNENYGGQLNDDFDDFIFGHRCKKLTLGASGTAEMYRESTNLAPHLQSILGQIGLWIKVDNTENLDNIVLVIYRTQDWQVDSYWTASLSKSYFGFKDDEWLYISLCRDNFNPYNLVAADWSTANPTCPVGLIRIILHATGPCEMKVGGIVAEDPPTGALVMGFDDAYGPHYDSAFSDWQPLGLKGTIFAPMSYVDQSGRLAHEDLKEMSDAGWEIGYHGYDHTIFTTQTPQADVWKDISDEKRAMANLDIPSPLVAAWPGNAGFCEGNGMDMGDISDRMFLLTRYRTQRTRYTSQDSTPDAVRILAGWTRTDLANLPGIDIGADWSEAMQYLDRAVAHRLVLSAYVHNIQETPESGNLCLLAIQCG